MFGHVDTDGPDAWARHLLRLRGAHVASVSRNGATVMSISGVVGALEPTDPSSGEVRTIMPRQRNVFLNAQTSHPLVSPF